LQRGRVGRDDSVGDGDCVGNRGCFVWSERESESASGESGGVAEIHCGSEVFAGFEFLLFLDGRGLR